MIRVLISTCMWSSAGLISLIRNNPDGEEVEIYGTNACEASIPKEFLNGWRIVPRYGDEYINAVIEYCKENKIDVVIPTIDVEVVLLAKNMKRFEHEGIHLSTASYESLEMIGDKEKLGNNFGAYMPKQEFVRNGSEVLMFSSLIGKNGKFCIKMKNSIGGHGFAIVDEQKANDIMSYGAYCGKDYITLAQALSAVSKASKENDTEVILQEYVEGIDYSVNILADHGKTVCIAGYQVPMIQEGFALHAKIHENKQAFDICKKIVEETGFDGNACFDFIERPDWTVALLEVNARINTNHVLVAQAGANMMWLRILMLTGVDISNREIKINQNAEMHRVYRCIYENC